ncbi:MAG TPA: hypothetical protein VKA05_00925 [Acidimicrobiales bacterium]|nr:hypothetical protein [Acidimicrobiales bacterium]
MDFWQTLALLGRRWRFFGVSLLVAIVATAGVYEAVKKQYQATTDLVLVPPSVSTTNLPGRVVSPYDLYGNLNTVASIVSYAESSQAAANRLKAQGVLNYTAGTDPTGAVPELILVVTASSPAAAITQDDILAKDVVATLIQAQQAPGINPDTYVTARYLARPVSAPADDKSRLRVGVAVAVVLGFLAVALTFLYDSTMRKRQSRRVHAREPEPDVSTLLRDDGFDSGAPDEQLVSGGWGSRAVGQSSIPFTASGQGSTRSAAGSYATAPPRGAAPAHRAQDR